jgi:hypothetical protein
LQRNQIPNPFLKEFPMAKKGTAVPSEPPAEAPSDTNGNAPEHNGQAPRKTVRTFSCPCGKDENLRVEVVESEHQTKSGKITILSAVCSRTYVNGDSEEKVSYSYRVQHIQLLTHLLGLAHAYIVSTRVVEDLPA